MKHRDVLIIGGTGVFGKRLVHHLCSEDGLTLHVSSRSAQKAADFIALLDKPAALLRPVALDCEFNLNERLAEIRPFAVIDCSGPFQGAGYSTAKAVLKSGAHFIDLADARDYLAGFAEALNDVAKQHSVAALTGASSTPTLSTCVTTKLSAGWKRVDTIDMAITPGGRSEVGRSVIEAIMSYAGKPIKTWREGRLTTTIGWQDSKLINIPNLGTRRVAAVETFDAEYLGPRLNVQSRVSFTAGLESRIEQWGIQTLAKLRKNGVIGSPKPLIPLLLQARKITRIPTSSSGGMLIEITGHSRDGVKTHAQWTLIARQDHGPNIPILPAAAALKRLLQGGVKSGARFAHEALSLEDILSEAQPYDINTRTDTQ